MRFKMSVKTWPSKHSGACEKSVSPLTLDRVPAVNVRSCDSKLWFVNDPRRRHANALNLANKLRVKYDRPTQQDVRHYLFAYLLLVREHARMIAVR